jgi:DNA-binding beta-propeller fold protein YncE
MDIDSNDQGGAAVRSLLAFPRVSWVTLATVLLTAGVLLTFGLEIRYIKRSRPAPELPAAIDWVSGSRGSGPGQFDAPIGLAVHPSGDIYVADLGNGRVQRLSADGKFLDLWPVARGEPLVLSQASDVAVGAAGEVYALDAGGNIYSLDPGGVARAVVSLAGLQAYSPRGIVVDAARGRFYVADTGHGRILVLNMDGTPVETWGGASDEMPGFEEPWGLGVDGEGNVFVAEMGSSRIRKMSPQGEILADWRTKGPIGDLAVGPDDRVYVTWASRAGLWVFDDRGKTVGQVLETLESRLLGASRGVAVVAPGEVVMGTESSIVRLSVQFPE